MKWWSRVTRFFSRLNCRLGGHTRLDERGQSRTTVGIPGGSMTDDYKWSQSRCLTCGRNLR